MMRSFVFGKFLPFHKGHEAMIRYALTVSDHVSVLICCSDKESVPVEVRKNWITETFNNNTNVEVLTYFYHENELPSTSVASALASRKWSAVFKKIFPDVQILVTSEPYGTMVAECMNIKHVAFDMDRKQFPVSASKIKADIVTNWRFLPDAVKPFYAIKVVILGTESTGKTTLTEKLAAHYRCSYVLEAARDLIKDSNEFSMVDLYRVVEAQTDCIEKAIRSNHAIVIIDTNIYITESYADYAFSNSLEIVDNVYEINTGGLYIYLSKETPYYQDGTRLSENERNILDLSHRKILTKHDIRIEEVAGDWGDRFKQAIFHIDKLLKQQEERI